MKISIRELEELTNKAVKSYGYRDDEVRIISEVLLYAQLRDNNQGVVKLIGKGIPRDPKAGVIIMEKETPISSLINGNKNHAMVVVAKAVEIVKVYRKNHVRFTPRILRFLAVKFALSFGWIRAVHRILRQPGKREQSE